MTHALHDQIIVINQTTATEHLSGKRGVIVGDIEYRIANNQLCAAYAVDVEGEVIALTPGEMWIKRRAA